MYKAIWNNTVIAESNEIETVENNAYFPHDALKKEFFRPALTKTTCPWKGVASYYDVIVDGDVNPGSAWTYPDPKKEAENIKGYVSFWRGVEVVQD